MPTNFRRRTLAYAIAMGFVAFSRAGSSALSADDDRHDHPRETFKVGHRIMRIAVPYSVAGSPAFVPPSVAGSRQVDVHLWYPADLSDYFHAPPTEYTSALNGAFLTSFWDPLSWKVASSSAREGPAILRLGHKYPVIVFSHGNSNAPIDYAFNLEDLASAGFVVAAPTHVNNSQDDVLMDSANTQAAAAGFPLPFACRDTLAWSGDLVMDKDGLVLSSPCSPANVALSIADRVRDITYTLDALPAKTENRVDLHRVGVFGHSRGTVTALTAAGGSAVWGISPDPRVKAIMGMAIGIPAITFSANISSIIQPTLLVSGSRDTNTPPSVSQNALELLASPEKLHVTIENAVHRTFDSTYCEQLQSAAAIAQGTSRALLDSQTALRILIAANNGVAVDYCGFETFNTPTDIRPLVNTVTGFDVTEDNVPTTGLTTGQLRPCISEMAVRFFGDTLGRGESREHDIRDNVPHACRDLTSRDRQP